MKAYIITIKNKLMNKIPYRYTTKIAITNHRRQRGYGRMPYPPNKRLLGWCTSCSGKRQSRAETSAPPTGCHATYGHKKRSPKSFDSEDLK